MVMRNTAIHPRKQKSLAKCAHLRTGWHEGEPVPGSERTRGSSPMTTPVLVLNASYEPINICGARRAPQILIGSYDAFSTSTGICSICIGCTCV